MMRLYLGEVAEQRRDVGGVAVVPIDGHGTVPLLEDRSRERFDFGIADVLKPQPRPRES